MVVYCIYCGQDKDLDHHVDCPIVTGIPEMVMGIPSRQNDIEFNLHLGGQKQLATIRKTKENNITMGTGDPERDKRIITEFISFKIRRLIPVIDKISHRSKSRFAWLAKRKAKNLDRQVQDLYKFAETQGIPKEKVDAMWTQKILLADYSGKKHIPAYRDTETDRLIYIEINYRK